jgi:hypothetical protein
MTEPSREELIVRTEAMRLDAISGQVATGGAGDSPLIALMGELDAMVELEILKSRQDA